MAALQVLSAMKSRRQSLSQLARCWVRFPQLIQNVRVRTKTPFDELDGVTELVSQAEAVLKPLGGRVLLRYSGTESKARLLLEGPELSALERWAQLICASIKRQVGD